MAPEVTTPNKPEAEGNVREEPLEVHTMMYLWIIERKSSRPIYYHEFHSEQSMDGVLVSGLLSALNIFSEEGISNKGIKSIEMGDLKWIYANDTARSLMLVAAADLSSNTEHILAQLEVIKNLFVSKFCIDEEYWEEWDGNTVHFREYSQVVNDLEAQWRTASEMMNVGFIFDLFGVFQEILMVFIQVINDNFTGFLRKEILLEISKYESQITDWLRKEASFDRFRIIELFLPQINVEKEEIIFNITDGTKVLGLNPIGLDPKILNPTFLIVIRHFKKCIKQAVGTTTWLKISHKYFRPFMFAKWDMLNRYQLTKELLKIMLD